MGVRWSRLPTSSKVLLRQSVQLKWFALVRAWKTLRLKTTSCRLALFLKRLSGPSAGFRDSSTSRSNRPAGNKCHHSSSQALFPIVLLEHTTIGLREITHSRVQCLLSCARVLRLQGG